jgi:hypothetical protein
MRQGMRIMAVGLALALAGCGYTPEQLAAQQAIRDQYAAMPAIANTPTGIERQAAATCETKVAFAMAASPIRGSLDVAGVVRQMQLQEACMQHWRRTGGFP